MLIHLFGMVGMDGNSSREGQFRPIINARRLETQVRQTVPSEQSCQERQDGGHSANGGCAPGDPWSESGSVDLIER